MKTFSIIPTLTPTAAAPPQRAIFLTNVNGTGDDVMVFTTLDADTIARAYQSPAAPIKTTFDECYEVPERDVQFYLYEPCYLYPKEEARARELAAASPHAAHSLVA